MIEYHLFDRIEVLVKVLPEVLPEMPEIPLEVLPVVPGMPLVVTVFAEVLSSFWR